MGINGRDSPDPGDEEGMGAAAWTCGSWILAILCLMGFIVCANWESLAQ